MGEASDRGNRYAWVLGTLLAAAVFKLWILPLRSSFWVDEMVTAFVVHYGPSHPSLAVAPQVTATIYYWLPWAAEHLLGFSEVAYRIPSTLLMGLSLFLLARLAMRLIHPGAGWFAVFAALSLTGINYEAADARPYALATCVAMGAVWFLIRWLDSARWLDAILFVAFGATLWRVHLIEWPFYAVLAAYTLTRAVRGETPVSWTRIAIVYAALGAMLVPVAMAVVRLLGDTKSHVIFDTPPTWREFRGAFKFLLIFGAGAGAWLLSVFFKWARQTRRPASAIVLIAGWWVTPPLALFAYSRLTGNNVFVPRYLWLSLPGAALAATAAVACFIPDHLWKPAAMLMGAVVVMFTGGVPHWAPLHNNSNWREAASKIREQGIRPDTPVIYPSPFIEAQTPVWHPDYPLPSFLYCHVLTYPVGGVPYLLPYARSAESEAYAARVADATLVSVPKFVVYGGDRNVRLWEKFLLSQPELALWRVKDLGSFGDVAAVVFENPDAGATTARNFKP